MNRNAFILVSAVVLSPAAMALPDPGAVSAGSPTSTACGTNPADGTSYRCYNPEWSTVAKIKEHLNYALQLGGHMGDVGTRPNSGTGKTEKHCMEDVLFNNVEAANRTLWTLKCQYVDYVKVKNFLYTMDRFDNPIAQPIVWYPLFGNDINGDNIYEVYPFRSRDIDYRTRTCDLPPAEKVIHWCEAGCFADDQILPYSIGGVEQRSEFKDIPLDQTIKVRTLSASSVLERLDLESTFATLVHHEAEDVVGGEVIEIFVRDEERPVLRVTVNHPLISADGEIVLPTDLSAGSQLLTTDGPREVTRVQSVPYKGDIFNVLPQSTDFNHNILVMDGGYIVGSQRVQNQQYGYVKRIFYRQAVDVD